jgi:DNA-binding MarR family transcriptional regulator
MAEHRTRREPLARLFLSAAGLLVHELHLRLAAEGWHDVRHSWGFVIGRLQSGPAAVNELANFLGVSKQAASKTIDHLESHGLVRISAHPDDGRMRMVELTAKGEQFRRDVEAIYDDIEGSWAAVIGQDEMEMIRERLTASLTTMYDGTLPPPAPLK